MLNQLRLKDEVISELQESVDALTLQNSQKTSCQSATKAMSNEIDASLAIRDELKEA